MKTRLIRIGNSRGLRLPKPLIEEAGFTDEVELRLRDGAIVISRVEAPRTGWAEAAVALHRSDEDRLLHEHHPTAFDESEWTW